MSNAMKARRKQTEEEFSQNFDFDAWEKYKRLWKRLDHIDSFFIANQISSMGRPGFTNDVPTAGIRVENGRVVFTFNRKFFNGLSDEDLAFVFVHEAGHIFLCHWYRGNRYKIWDNANPMYATMWNWACDCIVNAWAERLGFPASDEIFDHIMTDEQKAKQASDPEAIRGVITAEKIGYPNFNGNTTADDIFFWLQKKNEKELKKLDEMIQNADVHIGWADPNSNGDSGQTPKMDDFAEKMAGSIKKGMLEELTKNMSKEAQKKLKEAMDKAGTDPAHVNGNKFRQNYRPYDSWGRGTNGELRYYKNLKDRVQVDVLRLIHNRMKTEYDVRPKETWMRRPRKLAGIEHRNIIMPYEWEFEDKHKFLVEMVIDCSGSISDDMISQMVRFVRSFPRDEVEYDVISFDDKIWELNKAEFYDDNAYPKIPGRGGTNISLPEEYAQNMFIKKHGRRPDLVVIITDGDGMYTKNIDPKHQERYIWVLTKTHNERAVRDYCPKGIIYKTNIM